MKRKIKNQKGMSLAEVLVATFITTIIMGAAYVIYNNFQKTFVRQLGHNNVKQEARFALHALQYDSRMAGYKHPNSDNGEVQNPVTVLKVLNDVYTEVTDSTDDGEVVIFCFDTVNPYADTDDLKIVRKLIRYELKTPNSSETEKTILKRKVWDSPDCTEDGSETTVLIDWEPVAQYFSKFAVRIRSKHIDYEINLTTAGEDITEK